MVLIQQGFATRGAGAITVEATAVVPEGRISPQGWHTDTSEMSEYLTQRNRCWYMER
jgi:hypothetical protein